MKYGTSYAIATGFFPREVAKQVLLLYSFVRIPDNVVDEIASPHLTKGGSGGICVLTDHYAQAYTQLTTMKASWLQAYTDTSYDDPTRGVYVTLFVDHKIPCLYSESFFDAMIADCTVHRYETYTQLEGYMYGSASVVGLMMCHLIGYDHTHETETDTYATMLGNAMQLTNFLRDIREDYVDLGRIYIPSEDLARYGLTHEDIVSFCTTPSSLWKRPPGQGGIEGGSGTDISDARTLFMQDMITRCRTMYAQSMNGIEYLHPHGHQAVILAAKLYESILDKIESNHYDVFTHSCRTSLWDKIRVLVRS